MSVLASYSYKVSKEKSFPKLMIADDGQIVLFTSEKVGVRINSSGYFAIGTLGSNWPMSAFKDYEGEVTLKNE